MQQSSKAYGLPTSNQNEQQRFNYNVLTHDVMGRMVLVERYVSLNRHQPIAVIEATSRISLTWTLVNTLKWSTQWSTQTQSSLTTYKPTVKRP